MKITAKSFQTYFLGRDFHQTFISFILEQKYDFSFWFRESDKSRCHFKSSFPRLVLIGEWGEQLGQQFHLKNIIFFWNFLFQNDFYFETELFFSGQLMICIFLISFQFPLCPENYFILIWSYDFVDFFMLHLFQKQLYPSSIPSIFIDGENAQNI